MDFADMAAEREAIYRAEALERHQTAALRKSRKPAFRAARALCLECGRPIPPARREAVPGAEYCVTCQEAYERGDL